MRLVQIIKLVILPREGSLSQETTEQSWPHRLYLIFKLLNEEWVDGTGSGACRW